MDYYRGQNFIVPLFVTWKTAAQRVFQGQTFCVVWDPRRLWKYYYIFRRRLDFLTTIEVILTY